MTSAMGFSVINFRFCRLLSVITFTACLTTTSAKQARSASGSTTALARVPCGYVDCNPSTEYCDRDTQNCGSCTRKCANPTDKYVLQECNRQCKVFMDKKAKEKSQKKIEADSDSGRYDKGYDVILGQLKSLLTGSGKGDRPPSSSNISSQTVLIVITFSLCLAVIILGVIAFVLVKIYFNHRNLNPKNNAKNLQVRYKKYNNGGIMPEDDQDAESSKLNVDLKTKRKGSGASSLHMERLHDGEVEAGVKGDELGKNLKHSHKRRDSALTCCKHTSRDDVSENITCV